MKYVFFLMMCCLVSCTGQYAYQTVEIRGYDTDHHVIARASGVQIDQDHILTSAHAVRDDRTLYEVWDHVYQVISRDLDHDIAELSRSGDTGGTDLVSLFSRAGVQTGSLVSAVLMRSGALMTLTGTVTDVSGMLLGYDDHGRLNTLRGVLITDIEFVPGDSGAPIYDLSGHLLDLVHVTK